MSEPSKILSEALRQELKELLREVIREELAGVTNVSGHPTGRDDDDGLVNADKAAEFYRSPRLGSIKIPTVCHSRKKSVELSVSTGAGCADGSKASGVDIPILNEVLPPNFKGGAQ